MSTEKETEEAPKPRPTFRRDNHYTPCVYLKGFAGADKRVWVYRTLVSRDQVPVWKEASVGGVGYVRHLYTKLVRGRESDAL